MKQYDIVGSAVIDSYSKEGRDRQKEYPTQCCAYSAALRDSCDFTIDVP